LRILVTGATGFIGQHLIKELLKTGNTIIATSKEEMNEIPHRWANEVTYIKNDFNNQCDNYYEFFQKPDKLIHLAWEGLPNYMELFHFEKNVFSSYSFIKNLVTNGLKDVTVLGTCLEYGIRDGMLSELMHSDPSNPYALAKDTLRKFIEELSRCYSFNFKWIRLFYLYGKGQSRNSILEQLKKALMNGDVVFNMSGGEQLRDYLPVEKAAEYISKISMQTEINGIINCCSNKPISVRRLVENYLIENGKTIKLNLGYYPYPEYEPMAFWGDDSKLQKIIRGKIESTD